MTLQTRVGPSIVSTLKQQVNVIGVLKHRLFLNIFHADKPLELISKIRARKMKAGVAISPDTPSTAITDEVANAADMLLVMTVYPGISSRFLSMRTAV